MPCKNPPPCGKNYNQYRLASGVHCCRKKPVSKKIYVKSTMSNHFNRLPAHVVAKHIAKFLSPNNKRRLALATKTHHAFSEVRENVQKEKQKALKKHLLGLYAGSRIVGRRVLKERNNEADYNNNLNYGNPYTPHLNVYRWINVMKNRRFPKTGTGVTNPLTNNNINQIKKNILRKMVPINLGENMFIQMAGRKFSSKNGTATLRINEHNNTNTNNPILKMYIEKRQSPTTVAVYRIVPKGRGLNNHVTFLPLANYHNKNNVSNLGFVEVKGLKKAKKKKKSRPPVNTGRESYF